MRRTATLFLLLCGLAALGFSKDVFLSIGGTVGNGGVGSFRTDLRIFNPSSTKDIQIQAYFLPTGGGDNSGAQPKTTTVHPRQMAVYDDAITTLFSDTRLGGIRLSSADDFVATQKIYSVAANGTLGQFLPGIDSATAKKNGLLLQIKANGSNGQAGTFRTNIGILNPNNATANTTWRLYDKNNALVGDAKTLGGGPAAGLRPPGDARLLRRARERGPERRLDRLHLRPADRRLRVDRRQRYDRPDVYPVLRGHESAVDDAVEQQQGSERRRA